MGDPSAIQRITCMIGVCNMGKSYYWSLDVRDLCIKKHLINTSFAKRTLKHHWQRFLFRFPNMCKDDSLAFPLSFLNAGQHPARFIVEK